MSYNGNIDSCQELGKLKNLSIYELFFTHITHWKVIYKKHFYAFCGTYMILKYIIFNINTALAQCLCMGLYVIPIYTGFVIYLLRYMYQNNSIPAKSGPLPKYRHLKYGNIQRGGMITNISCICEHYDGINIYSITNRCLLLTCFSVGFLHILLQQLIFLILTRNPKTL